MRFGRPLFALVVTLASVLAPAAPAAASEIPQITLERPLAAITGSDYTLRPVRPAGYEWPTGTKCSWGLVWGDDAALFGHQYNETFGYVAFEGTAAEGYCEEWTFTLPYGPALQYRVHFTFCLPGSGCYVKPDPEDRSLVVKAKLGTTDRHIRRSSYPLAYVLPDKYIVAVGQPVTYTLYGSQGFTPPTEGTSWSASCRCPANHNVDRLGGRTFTFTPTQIANYRVDWMTFVNVHRRMEAFFDPPAKAADTSAPTITAGPYQRPKPNAMVGSTIPMSLGWTGADRGWGIDRYQLQESRSGGAWAWVALPTPLTIYVKRALTPNGSYRYRVRAIDKSGRIGAWAYTHNVYPRLDADTAATYSGSWTTSPVTGAVGGSVRQATSSAALATYRFTGQNVGIVAARGPGRGSARIYVDGVLVTTISLNASTLEPARIVFDRRWSVSGTHTVQVRPVGNGPINLDAFIRFG